MEDGGTFGTLGGGGLEKKVVDESLESMKGGKAKLTSYNLDVTGGNLDMICWGEIEIYIEPIRQPEKLIIFGAGYITRSLAPLMRSMGFRVTVVDDNPEMLGKNRLMDRKGFIPEDMESYAERLPPESSAYIVLLTRGFSTDKAIPERFIGKDFRYMGMIGRRKKIKIIKVESIPKGIEKVHFSKLYAPVSLDIGAETPEEIAVSIASEKGVN